MEQVFQILEAIRGGKLGIPSETADQIEEQCGFHRTVDTIWEPELKAWLKEVIKEVGVWPSLAIRWLEKTMMKKI